MRDLTVMDKYDDKDDFDDHKDGDDDDDGDGEVGCLTTMDMAPEGGCRS